MAGPRAGFHFRQWGSEPSDAVERGGVKKDFEVTGTNRRHSKEIKVARAGGGGAHPGSMFREGEGLGSGCLPPCKGKSEPAGLRNVQRITRPRESQSKIESRRSNDLVVSF